MAEVSEWWRVSTSHDDNPTDSAHIAGFVAGFGLIFLFRDPALVAAKRSLSE